MFNLRRITVFFVDVVLLAFVYFVMFGVLAFGYDINIGSSNYLLNAIVFFLCIFTSRLSFSIYSNIWRYANHRSYLKMLLADFVGASFALLITMFVKQAYVSVITVFVNVILFSIFSIISRFLYQYFVSLKNLMSVDRNRIPVGIIGAGQTGSLLVEELLHNNNSHYKPVCFIDVDAQKIGGTISGVKIIGEDNAIFGYLESLEVKELFVALPSLSSDEIQKIYDFYSKTRCKIKIYDFAMNGGSIHSGKRRIREIKIEDLLFRDSLNINNNDTFKFYTGKTVLVTGGGGSIGSEICRQIAKTSPKKLIIFDIYENNGYDIQQELNQIYGNELDFAVEIGSVRDRERLDELFDEYKPDIVFHAAAHKHVPLMEDNCSEAVKNNVLGTLNAADMAEKHNVKKFIMISTDKAVNPTNIMGASKRLCEMIVQSRYDSKTTEFAAVRFGNVLGSNGSVIPLFRRQIEAGGPVTVTDKRIIRYFMTIPEASQLVLQAGSMAKSGELFVLDMGNPVKIYDLAVNMIKLAGYVPNKDIDIIETGLRPGEKLYEELLIKTEEMRKTENNLIFIETDTPLSRSEVAAKLDILNESITQGNDSIREAFKKTIPTYKSPEVVNKAAEKSNEMQLVNS